MPGFRAAMKYAYSSTRVKAMESKLIRKEMFERMLAAKEPGSIAAMLLQTDYRQDVERLGGVKAMSTLIDFVLSKNQGRETSKLITIAPKDQRSLVIAIAGVWDIGNIKTAIEAVSSGKSFESVSRYLIDSRYAGSEAIKDAMASKSVEGAMEKLMLKTPYAKQIKNALDTYKKTGSAAEASAALERSYYLQLGATIGKLEMIDAGAADLIRKRIDMRNILTLLETKKHGNDFAKISGYLLPNGSLGSKRLESLFRESRSPEALAENVKAFNLKQAAKEYAESKTKPVLIFEIAMLNEIFAGALRGIRHSVLSFGALIAFLYLKEIEVFTLRVIMKGKGYGLSDQEIKGMISWLK
ncbi:MAG: V-type ATPase subunit [Candidatus Micrarchaeota archaeon]|nr:V-type ATPase subunit [Candidatus Micrarchaeota archaeon]